MPENGLPEGHFGQTFRCFNPENQACLHNLTFPICIFVFENLVDNWRKFTSSNPFSCEIKHLRPEGVNIRLPVLTYYMKELQKTNK